MQQLFTVSPVILLRIVKYSQNEKLTIVLLKINMHNYDICSAAGGQDFDTYLLKEIKI